MALKTLIQIADADIQGLRAELIKIELLIVQLERMREKLDAEQGNIFEEHRKSMSEGQLISEYQSSYYRDALNKIHIERVKNDSKLEHFIERKENSINRLKELQINKKAYSKVLENRLEEKKQLGIKYRQEQLDDLIMMRHKGKNGN